VCAGCGVAILIFFTYFSTFFNQIFWNSYWTTSIWNNYVKEKLFRAPLIVGIHTDISYRK
jgi:hypothetical protein